MNVTCDAKLLYFPEKYIVGHDVKGLRKVLDGNVDLLTTASFFEDVVSCEEELSLEGVLTSEAVVAG